MTMHMIAPTHIDGLPVHALQLGPGLYDANPIPFADKSLFEAARRATYLRLSDEKVIGALEGLFDINDLETLVHVTRVGMMAGALSMLEGRSPEEQTDIIDGGLKHDCWKDNLQHIIHCNRPFLNEAQRSDVELHPVMGERRVRELGANEVVSAIVLGHHSYGSESAYPVVGEHDLDDFQVDLLGEEALMGDGGPVQLVSFTDIADTVLSERTFKRSSNLIDGSPKVQARFTGSPHFHSLFFEGLYGISEDSEGQFMAATA